MALGQPLGPLASGYVPWTAIGLIPILSFPETRDSHSVGLTQNILRRSI